MAPKILVVLTSADKIVKIDKPTGWYLVRTAKHSIQNPPKIAAKRI